MRQLRWQPYGLRQDARDHRDLYPPAGLHQFYEPGTARSEKRARSGHPQTVGSLRGQYRPILGESVLLAFLSFVIAIALAALTLPWFNQLAGKTMAFPGRTRFLEPFIDLYPAHRSAGRQLPCVLSFRTDR
jgi:hypothetical protein